MRRSTEKYQYYPIIQGGTGSPLRKKTDMFSPMDKKSTMSKRQRKIKMDNTMELKSSYGRV